MAQQSGPGLVGDVNGDGRITSADALAVHAYLAGRPVPAKFDVLGRGDADGDGRITRADAELIMRVAVGQAVLDRPVGKPAEPGTGPAEGPIRLACAADLRTRAVTCEDPGAATPAGVQGDRIAYGGQHVNVSLLTGNVTLSADTFAFDLRVRNLIPQAIGTNDGTTVDPVRVFVSGEVQNTTAGNNGAITVANHDGTATALTAEPQKYFSYAEIIQPQATSAARRWKLHLAPGVQSFNFFLYVSSPVVYPFGWVDVYPRTAEIAAGATLQLTDTVRNHLGKPTGQKATWTSGSPAIVTVDVNGIVTAVGDGVVEITGTAAPRAPGKMTLTVRSASADSSRFTAAPDTLPVRQKSVITLQLRSATGAPLSRSGGTVVFATDGGTLSGVRDNGDGTYTDTLTSAAVGLVKVSGTLNGATLTDTARVAFTAGAATGYRVTSSAASVAAGSPVTITAQTIDADGNAVSGAGATITWTSTNGGSFASATSPAGNDGAASVVFTTSTAAGTTHTVTATDAATLTGTSGNIVTGAGAAAALVFTQQPGNTASGSAITPAVTVAVQDANGNVVSSFNDSVAVAIGDNPAGGTLSGTVKVAAVNGVATFSNLAIDRAGTGYTVAASGASLNGTSAAFNVVAGAASRLVLTTAPSASAQSGATFAQQPVIQLQDANGNPVAQNGVTVTAAIATGGVTLGGTVTVATNANGTATFTDLSITGTVGDRTLSFTADGVATATSGAISVTAGAASRLVIATQPSSTAAAGAAFAQQPVVQLQDVSGNAVAQPNLVVTAAIATGGGALGGTATASTDANGTATFTDLSIGGTVGGRTLTFSADAVADATSGTIGVTAGAASALAFTVQPSNVVATAPITPAVQVSVNDAFGNVVTGFAGNVTVAIGNNPSGGVLSGTATVAAAGGVATFSGLSINLTGTGYTLTAASDALTGTSAAFDVTHGPLHHFVVQAAGGGAIANQLAGTPFNVRVTAQDEYNNTVTSFSGTVGFTSSPTGGIGGGATSPAFTAGVLSSHSITFGTPGAFTLTATNTAAGAQSGTSNSFEVQAPPIAVNEGPAANSAPGQPFHAFYSTSGSPQTFSLTAPGVTSNDNLGFPAATVTSFGADSLGNSVTTHAAASTVSPLPGRNTGSLSVGADGTITFTPPDGFTGNYVFRYRLTNVRGTADGQVTIAVGTRPAAVNDTYSPVLVGNVPVNTATSTQFRVTTNDAGDRKVLAMTGTSNGTATLNADSTFTFRPNAGYNGPASFTYTVTNGFGTSAPATVSLTVGTPIWFLNAGAAAGGDGRYDAPFNALGSFAAINNGTGNNPAANDGIFMYTGTYTGPVTLLSGQRLIGQAATAALSTIAGVTWPADSGPEPVMSGGNPTIVANNATAVTLANIGSATAANNTLRGFNLGNVGATGTDLAGTSFGTLVISEVGINSNGQALNLNTGTLNGSFPMLGTSGGANNIALVSVATTGTSTLGASGNSLSGATATGAAGGAVYINGQNGSFVIPSSITNTASFAVNVINKTGGTVDFDAQVTGTNAGVFLNSNTGATIRFDGGMSINSGSANAFTATGGGTVVATQNNSTIVNTLTSAGGIALNVANTTIGTGGLNFRNITASGGSNGIVLNNTGATAGLTVVGTGSAGTGGTIQNTSGADGTTAGIGIYLNNTRAPSFSWMQLNGHAGWAIRGMDVVNLTLANVVVNGTNGTDANTDEGAVFFTNLTGTASVTNSAFSGGAEDNFRVFNTAGTLNRITFNTVNFGANSTALGSDALLLQGRGNSVLNATITGSTFTSSRGDLFQFLVEQQATGDLVFTGNALSNNHPAITSNGGGMTVTSGGDPATDASDLTYNISGNSFRGSRGAALVVQKLAGQGTAAGTVDNNTIGVTGQIRSGSIEASGISMDLVGAGSHTTTITNNTIRQYRDHGIYVQTGNSAAGGGNGGRMVAIVNNNLVAERAVDAGTGTFFPGNGIRFVNGNVSTDVITACLTATGNTVAGQGVSPQSDIRVWDRWAANTFALPGLPGPTGDASAFVQSNNVGSPSASATSPDQFTTSCP